LGGLRLGFLEGLSSQLQLHFQLIHLLIKVLVLLIGLLDLTLILRQDDIVVFGGLELFLEVDELEGNFIFFRVRLPQLVDQLQILESYPLQLLL